MCRCLLSVVSVKYESPPLLAGCLASDKNREVRMDYNICAFIKLKRYLVEILTFLFDYYFIQSLPN